MYKTQLSVVAIICRYHLYHVKAPLVVTNSAFFNPKSAAVETPRCGLPTLRGGSHRLSQVSRQAEGAMGGFRVDKLRASDHNGKSWKIGMGPTGYKLCKQDSSWINIHHGMNGKFLEPLTLLAGS